jgi:hypothetical protein
VSRIEAGVHLKHGNMALAQLVPAAVRSGWADVAEFYGIEEGSEDVYWFLQDLMAGARGPFAPLLLAIADAAAKHYHLTEDLRVSIEEDGFPDWWRLKETAEPVLHALAYALACTNTTQTVEDWEATR